MDMLELKSVWSIIQNDLNVEDRVGTDSIVKCMHAKSRTEIAALKKSLHQKFIIASLAIIVAIVLAAAITFEPGLNPLDSVFTALESSILFAVMAASLIVMVFFNYRAYARIRSAESSSVSLREKLEHYVDAMNTAILFNIYSDTIMSPIIFAWVYYAYAFEDSMPGFDLRTILLLVLPVMIAVLSYRLQSYMQRLRFGQYMDRLNEYLDSLKNNSDKL